jgi:hypothetical protein
LRQLQGVDGNALKHISIRNNFLSTTPVAHHLRGRMNKWDCIKLKVFCTAKETVTRLPTEQEKIFASYSSDERQIS